LNAARSPTWTITATLSFQQPALVFDARNMLERVPMLLEAREMTAHPRRDIVDLAESSVRDHDRDERWPVQHREAHATYRFPRRVGDG
jgi:hypothetical protein